PGSIRSEPFHPSRSYSATHVLVHEHAPPPVRPRWSARDSDLRVRATLKAATMKKKKWSTQEILAVLRSENETLRRFGVRRIGLFGSHANGRQNATSDVDLVVDFDPPSF